MRHSTRAWFASLALAAVSLALGAPASALAQDSDGDGYIDGSDNCPTIANPDQSDCDHDGTGDPCENSQTLSTGNMGAIGYQVTASGTLTGVGPTLWPVRLTIRVVGDLNLSTEYATLVLAGTTISTTLFQTGASACPGMPDVAQITLTAEQWNALVAISPSGNMAVTLTGSPLVSATQCPNGSSVVEATLSIFADCNNNGRSDLCDIATGISADCNGNLIPDSCDVESGFDHDCNGNGVLDICDIGINQTALDDNHNCYPDSCEFKVGDFSLDGAVDAKDLAFILSVWGNVDSVADLDGNGIVDGGDLGVMFAGWGPSPFARGTCAVPDWATTLQYAPDPAVVTRADVRSAILATGLPWRVRDNASNIEMLVIPPGTFNMGCSASTSYGCGTDENPVHQVTLTNAFYLGRTEVTQAQWQAEMGSNPSYFGGQPNNPVESVSWNTIQGFLSQNSLRLPTEAEWEYAYRAGTTTAFHSMPGYPSGTDADLQLTNIAWYSSNSGSQTHAVAGKVANGLGLHDMSGNVWEWCNDWYSSSYYASSPGTNPTGPSSGWWGSTRVFRGGSWYNNSYNCRSSNRYNTYWYSTYLNGVGFRVARTP